MWKPTLILIFILAMPLYAQDRPRKPVLIRDDEPREAFDEEIVTPDPFQARQSLKIGDFYFKKKNYRAAEKRYNEARRYLPNWPEPYEKLAKTYRKQKHWQKGSDICRLFLATNPDSPNVGKFEKLRKEFDSEASSSKSK